jgi:hypothetical protein
MRLKISILVCVLFSLYGVCYAAPVITNVTGTTTRTITGTNLMNQNTSGWQLTESQGSFEGASAVSDGYTCIYGPCDYTTNVKLLGNKSLVQKSTSGGGATCTGGTVPWHMYGDVYRNSSGSDVYWRYYIHYTSSMSEYFSKISYFKFGYMFSGTQYWDWGNSPSGYPDTLILKPYAISHYHSVPIDMPNDNWYCFEGRATKSGGNSTVTYWIDGIFVASDTDSTSDPDNPGIFIFPFTNSCVTSSVSTQGTSYTDGFMMSSQRINPAALIVLGNNSNYSTATKVVQHPTTLSNTSISFTYSETGYSPSGSTVSSMSGTDRYVWVIDNNQSVSNTWTLTGSSDTTAPTVTAFTIPSTASSLTVNISTFTASDNVGVTGYLITESGATPNLDNPLWSESAWTAYTFDSDGAHTLYAWAKDAAGNISSSANDSVTITLATCETDALLCTTEGDCSTYWPAYYWCNSATCQETECDVAILDEDFDDTLDAGWYWDDSADHSDVVTSTGCESGHGNCLRWHWTAGQYKPDYKSTGDWVTMRHALETAGEIFIRYRVKFDSGWQGSGESFHPHLILFPSDEDSAYCPLAANILQTYIEFGADANSPYTVRPVFGFQDLYRTNDTDCATLPTPCDLSSTTEERSTFECNQPVSPTPTAESCYASGNYWYSAALWKQTDFAVTKGVWHQDEIYIKMNTISESVGQADGIYKRWIDGQLVTNYTNMLLRTNEYPDLTWGYIVFAPYFGSPPGGSPIEQTMWIDDIEIYSSSQDPVTDTPVVTTASIDQTTVSLTTDVATVWSGYDANDCQLTCSVAGSVNLTSPSGSGTDWELTADSLVGYGDTCMMACTLGTDDVENAGGDDMESFSDFGVQVETQDTSVPIVSITNTGPINIGSNSVTLTGTCSDDQLVSGIKWRVNEQPDADNGTACSGTTEWTCNVTDLSRGANTVYIGGYDAVPNFGFDTIGVNSVFANRYKGGGGGRGIALH